MCSPSLFSYQLSHRTLKYLGDSLPGKTPGNLFDQVGGGEEPGHEVVV